MANPEHFARLKKSVEAWNVWRSENPRVEVDLMEASLRSENLSCADLRKALLHSADLTEVDLSGANLSNSNLVDAKLVSARLCDADLSFANLCGARLIRANLRGANLLGAAFDRADLNGSDFRNARVGITAFVANDLSGVKGLEAVRHTSPSTISIDTAFRSNGNIPESFLRGAGVPETFITQMKSLVALAKPADFYSCFISYSSKDDAFATELHATLQAQHVRCWKDSEDLKVGDRFQEEIEKAIGVHDKLLLVLSENSINSSWVEREVQAAFEKERRHGSTVLFPVRLDDAVMDCSRAWAADIRRTRHIGDFRKWEDHDSFQKSLDLLLRDLKTQNPNQK